MRARTGLARDRIAEHDHEMSDVDESELANVASDLVDASAVSNAQLDGYWRLKHDDAIVFLWRTDKRSDDMTSFLSSFGGIFSALDGRDVGAFGLLADLRASVGRNDPEFEDGLQKRRRELFERFKYTAIVVETAVGQLQVQRHIIQDGHGHKVRVFTDPDEALTWLQST